MVTNSAVLACSIRIYGKHQHDTSSRGLQNIDFYTDEYMITEIHGNGIRYLIMTILCKKSPSKVGEPCPTYYIIIV